MENQEKNKLSEWLDKIQQDSWQLELVVTAFSIFLLLGLLDKLNDTEKILHLMMETLDNNASMLVALGYYVLYAVTFFTIINLIVHVILRGLWISAVGLRSVSGDIDYENLRFSLRFEHFLRKRTGNFDLYVGRLENLCSIIFAITFLIVFMFISAALWIILLIFLASLCREYLPENLKLPFSRGLVLILVSSGTVYFLDFVTLGWVKRQKWLQNAYFPIYRFYSIITLAGLYRPIYYNLIDNKLGRRVGLMLIPYVMGVLWFSSLHAYSHVWYPEEEILTVPEYSYDDKPNENGFIGKICLPSKFVGNGYLEVFIQYLPVQDDPVLEKRCPTIKVPNEQGIGSEFFSAFNAGKNRDNELTFPKGSLFCMSSLYSISVEDSIYQVLPFKFYQHPNAGEKGLSTILDVQYLPRGEHHVLVKKWRKKNDDEAETPADSLVLDTFAIIPFWKE